MPFLSVKAFMGDWFLSLENIYSFTPAVQTYYISDRIVRCGGIVCVLPRSLSVFRVQ